MCGQLNQGFTYSDRPLNLLMELYYYGMKTTASGVPLDERSVKIAYNLFNRYHAPPTEVSTALLKINTLSSQDLSQDPENTEKCRGWKSK